MRNPVRDILLRKLEETRVELIDGKVEEITNLEMLANVIFENAIKGRGRTALENARLLFEYAVGKPKNTLEIESGNDRPFAALSREEILEEQMRAARELGIDAEWRVVDERDDGVEEGATGEGREGSPRLLEAGTDLAPEAGAEAGKEGDEEGGEAGKENVYAPRRTGKYSVEGRTRKLTELEEEIERALSQRQDDMDYYHEEDF